MDSWKVLVVFCCLAYVHLSRADSEEDSSEHGVAPGSKMTNCTCGVANRGSHQRIIGGVETKINEYPYMAGIVYMPRKMLYCGGTLISSFHVLTASHCIEPVDDVLDDVQVVLGEHDQNRVDESPETRYYEIERAMMHPEYYILGHKNDIALITLAEEVEFSRAISPVCLLDKPIDLVGKRVKILGWGKLAAEGPASKVLMKAMLNVIPLEKCNVTYEFIDLEQRTQICTFHPKKDACQDQVKEINNKKWKMNPTNLDLFVHEIVEGDSGGPLLYLDRETNRYTLAGIISFGKSCAAGFPAINVDVTKYLDWIQFHVQKASPGLQTCAKVEE